MNPVLSEPSVILNQFIFNRCYIWVELHLDQFDLDKV